MKIICNRCYAKELVIHNYNGILYADICNCVKEDIEVAEDLQTEIIQDAIIEGYETGYKDGVDSKEALMDATYKNGYNAGKLWKETRK